MFLASIRHARATKTSALNSARARRAAAISNAIEPLELRVLLAYTLDPSFGGDGLVEGQGGENFFLQNTGVVAQSGNNQIRRVNADGSLDTGFGNGGQVTTPFPIADIENAGNRFLVLGRSPTANKVQIAAYTVNGALDTSFGGGDGIAEASSSVITGQGGHALSVAPDGKIVAVGSGTGEFDLTNLVVFRFNADGSLDSSFAGDGSYDQQLPSDSAAIGPMDVQGTGHVLLAYDYFLSAHTGTQHQIIRLNPDGTFDKTVDSFDEDFSGPAFAIRDLEVANDNSFYVANGAQVYRYTANGDRDSTFNTNGLRLADPINHNGEFNENDAIVGLTPFGSGVLVTGALENNNDEAPTTAFVARLLANGSPDPTFSGTPSGMVSVDEHPFTAAQDVRYDAFNRVFVGGSSLQNVMDPPMLWVARLTDQAQTPFPGSPFSTGVAIQAEDFDRGGEGVAYHDSDATNNGGAYRPTESVDIETTTDAGGGHNVGWITPGEWLEYTVNLGAGGRAMPVELRLATPKSGGMMRFVIDAGTSNQIVGETFAITNTGGFQTWQTLNKFLPAVEGGTHTVRLEFVSSPNPGGMVNLNWMKINPAPTADTQAPGSVPNFRSTTVTNSSVTVAWDAATDNVGVTGYEIWFHPNTPTLLGPDQRSFTFSGLAPNRQYTFEIRAVDAAGNRGPISAVVATTGSLPVTSGLKGEYFNNMDFTAPVFTRTDATVDFNWGTGSPDSRIAPDTFSVRWSGQIQVPTTGRYTFYTSSDDGMRLTINGQRIIDKLVPQATTEHSGSIDLVAGQKYDIVLEYFDRFGGANARLSWSGPGITKQVVPQSALFSSGGAGADTQAPSSVSNFRATRSAEREIDVAWDGATDNVGVAGFELRLDNGQWMTFDPDARGWTFRNLQPGTAYQISIRAFDAAGNRGPISTVNAITTGEPTTGNGLRGDYYDNMDFTTLLVTRTDPTINFNWGTGSPDPRIQPDTFAVRWDGQIAAPTTGRYTFYTTTDDGVRLTINGQRIIDKMVPQSATEHSGSIDLVAGQKYDIVLEYFERAGGARAELRWSGPGVAKQIVPQSALFS